jgi:trans-aconitate 2-methyltransferase
LKNRNAEIILSWREGKRYASGAHDRKCRQSRAAVIEKDIPGRGGVCVPTWNAEQYLKFGDERAQPCRDLIARIAIESPARIIDLGCGPGNSAAMLAERWPEAKITGLDNSEEMIGVAAKACPTREWRRGEIAQWATESGERFDIVFSNAALQWVGEHRELFPKLVARVAPGGAFAAQMPSNEDERAVQLPRELAVAERWRKWFAGKRVHHWGAQERSFYYDALAPMAERIDLWETRYVHVFANADAIVEWYKGSGLRPYLEAIGDETARAEFLKEYIARVRRHYLPRASGKVLFPFRRLFVIAYRGAR